MHLIPQLQLRTGIGGCLAKQNPPQMPRGGSWACASHSQMCLADILCMEARGGGEATKTLQAKGTTCSQAHWQAGRALLPHP